ncbi:MAG: low specificity L-threonine aldolase [Acidobacteriia bacterium]|jgi:threonine aldolase|nr:low specificity L-threonine aldolase [Terriglobia bacterium]
MIDLRSDTVTKPNDRMRRAMAEAEVGDDVYGEDPTVNRLEARAAEILGKEAALFVPTGTMGNTIGIKLLTEHGQEVICDSRAHILDWELSMLAWFSGCLIRAVPTDNGILTWDGIKGLVKPVGPHWAPTGVIELENTHNMGGGRVYPQAVIDEICDEAHAVGVPVHMDGARLFNAAEAAGRPVRELVAKVDTVTFCLSKALGAPVGSMVAGPRHLMDKGRLLRKRLGGGMRQAGVLAAAGLIALEEGPGGLETDHANAQYIAGRLGQMERISVFQVETNIVIYDVSATGRSSKEISAALKARGVLMNGFTDKLMRAVTHRDVSRAECETAMDALEEVVRSTRT